METRVVAIEAEPLAARLVDPFVIASGRVDVTPNVALRVTLESGEVGIGEAATLPPVTRETAEEVLASVRGAAVALTGRTLASALDALDEAFAGRPVARAGVEAALLDARAKRERVPLRALLGGARGAATSSVVTDITIPILAQDRMVELARGWAARGFDCFKVKVGKDPDHDARALEAIAKAVPGATFRVDANAGFAAKDAVALARGVVRAGVRVECWEQPCAKEDLDGMAEVTRALPEPVVADESVATLADLARVAAARAARAINLKLAKSGGPLAAYALGERARALGMSLMMGGMVETRLGMATAAHVACALGGVDFPDLDTAWLLADDPFEGGYDEDGPRYTLRDPAGHGVRRRRSR